MSSSTLYVISPEEAARLRMEAAVSEREKVTLRSAALKEEIRAYSAGEPCHRIVSDIMEVCNSVRSGVNLNVEELERENAENNAKLAMIHDFLSNPGIQSILSVSHGIYTAKDKVGKLCDLAREDDSLKYETDKLNTELGRVTSELEQIMSANVLALSEPEIKSIQLKAQDIYYRFIHYADEIAKLSTWRKERKSELVHDASLVDFEAKEIMSFQELVKTYNIIESSNPKRAQIKALLAEAEKYMVYDEDKEKLKYFSQQYECGNENALLLIKVFLHALIMRPPAVTYEVYCMLAREVGVEPAAISSFSSITDLQISLDDIKLLYTDKVKKQFIKERINETLEELGFEQMKVLLEERDGEINLISKPESGQAFIINENEEQNFLYLESVMLHNGSTAASDNEIIDYREGCCKVMDMIIKRLSEKGVDVAVKRSIEPKANNCTFIGKSSIATFETTKRTKTEEKAFTNSISED